MLAECPQCYCGKFHRCLHFLPVFIVRKLTIGLIIRYVSLNIIVKIITTLNPTSSPGLKPRTAFKIVTLVPVISSPKRTNFVLAPFFYRA
jgi:hypothetical protein